MGETTGRGVRVKQNFAKGTVLCDYNGQLLNPTQTKLFYEEAERDDGQTEYTFNFQYSPDPDKTLHETYMINANKEPETKSFGRIINHCLHKQNVQPTVFTIENQPFVLFVAQRDIYFQEQLYYDYGDRRRNKREEWYFNKDKKTCICESCYSWRNSKYM